MIEQSGHRYTLLVAAAQGISPFSLGIPSAFAFDNVGDLDYFKDLEEILIALTSGVHVGDRVRIDDLISERA
jgi:hypothetical protein